MNPLDGSPRGADAPGVVGASPGGFEVDGLRPRWLCRPESRDDVLDIARWASAGKVRLVVWGGGTCMGMGHPPRGYDAAVLMKQLGRVLELDEENMTVTVEAGMAWRDLQELLAREGGGYEVPLDPPLPDRATVGGVLAAGIAGPRLALHGSARNRVLGVELVTARGMRASFGGKTVKNVAGLDMTKIFVGSCGTLGVIVAATLRLAPVSPANITGWIASRPEALWELTEEIGRSSLYPSRLCWLPPAGWRDALLGSSGQGPALAISFEGSRAGVRERWQWLERQRGKATVNRVGGEEAEALWRRVQDLALAPPELRAPLSLRIGVPPAGSRRLEERLVRNGAAHFVIHPAAGQAFAHWDLDRSDADPRRLVDAIRRDARAVDGYAVVAAAPEAVKPGIDVWGFEPDRVRLMSLLKKKLDPMDILAPGRLL